MRIRLEIFYIFLIVHKSPEKTKTSDELILQASSFQGLIYYSSVSQSSIVVSKIYSILINEPQCCYGVPTLQRTWALHSPANVKYPLLKIVPNKFSIHSCLCNVCLFFGHFSVGINGLETDSHESMERRINWLWSFHGENERKIHVYP